MCGCGGRIVTRAAAHFACATLTVQYSVVTCRADVRLQQSSEVVVPLKKCGAVFSGWEQRGVLAVAS